MKRFFSYGSIALLTLFLTACPAAQLPVELPVTDVSGTWTGLISDLESDNSISFTVDFEQMGAELSGTATLGPAGYSYASELSGQVDGDNVAFTFTLVFDGNSDVTTLEVTYTLTGALEGSRLRGELLGEAEGLDEIKGEFDLERQPTAPQEPSEPDPGPTFPVSEISGTLLGWTSGEAFLTLTGGYSDSFTGDPETDGVDLGAPTYETTLASDGSFSVTLSAPDASELIPLTCNGVEYPIGFLALAVASSVPQPTQSEEVFGVYTLGPVGLPQDAV